MKYFFLLIIMSSLGFMFYKGLKIDPSIVPSNLIDEQTPNFQLKKVGNFRIPDTVLINTNSKKNNLTFSEEFLLYDYKYHNNYNFKFLKNKNLRKFFSFFINLINYLIDMNRLSILSTNVLVKYIYVPKFSPN